MTAKDLKASILQLAIQGKLVPQDPNDEPASALLERIRMGRINSDSSEATLTLRRTRKTRNVSGASDKSELKKHPPITDDEKPFDLPEGWVWCRLGEISENVGARENQILAKEIKKVGAIPVVSQGQAYIDGYCDDQAKAIKDVPVVMFGDHTKNVKYIDFSFVIGADGTKVFKSQVDTKWLYYWTLFQSTQIGDRGYGRHWGLLNKRIVALPPLAEQKRIVAKIEELMPMVERYGAVKEQSDALEAALPDAFRKSVLQYAIQGKLVPQDPNDEPASALLERIRMGRINSDSSEATLTLRRTRKTRNVSGASDKSELKKHPPITDDEKPFDLPEGWAWCKFGDLFKHSNGKQLNSSDKAGKMRKYITTSNLYWGRFELNNLKEMPFKDEELDRCTAHKGDLLICEGGDVGRAAIWQEDYDICLQNHVHKARPYVEMCVPFFYYLLRHYKDVGVIAGRGVGIQGLSSSALGSLIVPLPPLAEQKRIVAEVERLLAMGNHVKAVVR